MTSALDQVTSMMEANRRLTLTLAEITQASGETYMRLGSQAATRFAEQARHLASGEVTGLFADNSPLVADLRSDHEAAVKKAAAALAEWQKALAQAWTATLDQKAATEAFQGLLQPWSAYKPAAADGAKAEVRVPRAKAAD